MKSSSGYVKQVKFELGYGGCSAPSKPVPIWLPGAVLPIAPPALPKVRRPTETAAER